MTRLFEDEVLLVSGFPGFRARKLVAWLLENTAFGSLELIVHPRRRAEALAILGELAAGDRVRLLDGDPGAIDFGLSRSEYLDLGRRVQRVFSMHQVTDAALDE